MFVLVFVSQRVYFHIQLPLYKGGWSWTILEAKLRTEQ